VAWTTPLTFDAVSLLEGVPLSLRMNLYGWSLASFTRMLGSKDSVVLEAANARLAEALPEERVLTKGRAWLRTLIETGFALRQDRAPASAPADGGLLTMQMETEAHVFVVHSIARAIAGADHLDLSNDSSTWAHPAVGSLYNELAACEFSRSKHCRVEYFTWMWKLSHGSPLFGDDFRSEWSFYTLFTNQELTAILPVFQAAAEFNRKLPESLPEEVASKIRFSDGYRVQHRAVRWRAAGAIRHASV
jgi:hypothetical protein